MDIREFKIGDIVRFQHLEWKINAIYPYNGIDPNICLEGIKRKSDWLVIPITATVFSSDLELIMGVIE